MKKYINSSLILLVVLLSLTVFYVSQATSSSNLPDFHLKQTHGDSKLLDTLALEAAYMDTDYAEYFTTTKDGTHYRSETSFFEQVDYWQKTSKTIEMKSLRKQFPSFMRGKSTDTQLYHDTKQVIYVDITYDYSNNHGYYNFGLKINHLNKKTKDTQTFEVKIPNQENSGYIDVLDVQIIKDELRVVVLSDDEAQKINEYTISISKERLIDDTSIFTATNQSDKERYYFSRLMENEPTQTNAHFLFQIDQHTLINGGENSQTINIDFYSYTYKTGKLDKLKLPEDMIKQLLDAGSYTIAYDSKSLYLSIFNNDENRTTSIKMIKYNLQNQKITKNHTIKIDSDVIEGSHNIHLYQNNLFLIYTGEESKPEIKIFDFDSGKPVLEASLEVKDHKQKVDYKDISIHEVNGM